MYQLALEIRTKYIHSNISSVSPNALIYTGAPAAPWKGGMLSDRFHTLNMLFTVQLEAQSPLVPTSLQDIPSLHVRVSAAVAFPPCQLAMPTSHSFSALIAFRGQMPSSSGMLIVSAAIFRGRTCFLEHTVLIGSIRLLL
jgi:hypothetical protein